ncbi:MAG: large-conductance mechanosensitive channel protein MscL [Cyclobacteriaceae bacterium]|nr:large-conductance mechanosensitive channel protein MscL [Cyclobacteriaceae bacterium]
MLKEFKEFAMRGNVIDLAVGLVIGVAFSKIVTSVVNDIIMPPIGILIGGVDFSDLRIVLKDAQGEIEEVSMNYGVLTQTIVEFVIIAFAVFLVVKGINSMKRKKEEAPAAPPAPPEDVRLLTEIRDLLRK